MANKLLLVAGILLFTAHLVFAVDFSGEWTLNKDKSDTGEGRRGRFYATKLDVKQEVNKISIERTSQGRNGERTRSATISMDGKENQLEGFRGSTRIVTANWSDDKESLVIASEMKMEREGNTFEMTSKEVWKLEGGTLVLETEMKSPRGERKSTLIYDKAK